LKSPPHCHFGFLPHILVSIGLNINETGKSLGSAVECLLKFLIGHFGFPFDGWTQKRAATGGNASNCPLLLVVIMMYFTSSTSNGSAGNTGACGGFLLGW
jgi:hypothetical protein